MAKADPFAQHRLLTLAELDQKLGAAAHRRATLPELSEIAATTARLRELDPARILTQTELSDLDKRATKLDVEIDLVRARTVRDTQRSESGAAGAKELENLQHEIVSLHRRQSTLEDQALELMEDRETAATALAVITTDIDAVTAAQQAAASRRDAAFADIDAETGRLGADRAALTAGLPPDLLALYEKIHRTGRVAAGQLLGRRCGACRIDLDSVEVGAVRAAPVDEITRCTECGAILIRT